MTWSGEPCVPAPPEGDPVGAADAGTTGGAAGAEAGRTVPALQAAEDGNLGAARETPDRPDVHENDPAVHGTERHRGAVERDGSGSVARGFPVTVPSPSQTRRRPRHPASRPRRREAAVSTAPPAPRPALT